MNNPFENYEAWRLQGIAELVDMLYFLQSPEFDQQDFCDRLHNTARMLEQMQEPDPLANLISPNELKLIRQGEIPK